MREGCIRYSLEPKIGGLSNSKAFCKHSSTLRSYRVDEVVIIVGLESHRTTNPLSRRAPRYHLLFEHTLIVLFYPR